MAAATASPKSIKKVTLSEVLSSEAGGKVPPAPPYVGRCTSSSTPGLPPHPGALTLCLKALYSGDPPPCSFLLLHCLLARVPLPDPHPACLCSALFLEVHFLRTQVNHQNLAQAARPLQSPELPSPETCRPFPPQAGQLLVMPVGPSLPQSPSYPVRSLRPNAQTQPRPRQGRC